MAIFYALVISCLYVSALAQVTIHGHCPRLNGTSDLDANRFAGKWYEVKRYVDRFEDPSVCNVCTFQPTENNTIVVKIANICSATGEEVVTSGEVVPDPKDPSVMLGKIPLSPHGKISRCYFLGTDYDNWGVNSCCTDYHSHSEIYLWILARDRNFDTSTLQEAYDVIDRNLLDRHKLQRVNQTDCTN